MEPEEQKERWEHIQRELDRKYARDCLNINAKYVSLEETVKLQDADATRIMELGLEQLRRQRTAELTALKNAYDQAKHEQTEELEKITSNTGLWS